MPLGHPMATDSGSLYKVLPSNTWSGLAGGPPAEGYADFRVRPEPAEVLEAVASAVKR
jgi:hypothetical protein